MHINCLLKHGGMTKEMIVIVAEKECMNYRTDSKTQISV